jgi:CheY-like chemotaxis protein
MKHSAAIKGLLVEAGRKKSMSTTATPAPDRRADAPTLLYVEDDAATACIFKTILVDEMQRHVRLLTVLNGESALMALAGTGPYVNAPRPDMIVLDLNLPGVNGLILMTKIREMSEFRHIPIIFFSSSKLHSDHRAALALGALAFVHKPIKFDDFWRAVDSIYSLFASTQDLQTRL